jgi:hypothetical protein
MMVCNLAYLYQVKHAINYKPEGNFYYVLWIAISIDLSVRPTFIVQGSLPPGTIAMIFFSYVPLVIDRFEVVAFSLQHYIL